MDRMTQESLLGAAVSGQPGPGPSADEALRCWQRADLARRLDGSPLWPPPEALTDNQHHARLTRLARAVEAELIPRLLQEHRHPPTPADLTDLAPCPAGEPTADDVQLLAQRLLSASDEDLLAEMDVLRARGISVERIYLDILTPVARHYGLLWEDDRCDFTDVTVAVGRLQQLVRTLSGTFLAEERAPLDGRRILLLPAQGEQHTMGLSVVASFFRRAGWHVLGMGSAQPLDPVEAVQESWIDLLGISVGSETRLEWLTSAIAGVRQASRNPGVRIIVGGPVFLNDPAAATRVGADGVATDAPGALELATRLLSSRTLSSER